MMAARDYCGLSSAAYGVFSASSYAPSAPPMLARTMSSAPRQRKGRVCDYAWLRLIAARHTTFR